MTASPAAKGEVSSAILSTSTPRTPVYFWSHGGPNFMFRNEGEPGAFDTIRGIGKDILEKVKPRAIVVVSGHWEESEVQITAAKPLAKELPLVYDFYNFPQKFYEVKFPNTANNSIAQEVQQALSESGIKSSLNYDRGIDHGLWVPAKVAFQDAAPTVIQVSLCAGGDVEKNFQLGQALSSLREKNVVIVGSGMSVHNLRDFFGGASGGPVTYSKPFDDELKEIVEGGKGLESYEELIKKPITKKAHPTIEHLLPIVVAAGAANGEHGKQLYTKVTGSLAWGIYKFE